MDVILFDQNLIISQTHTVKCLMHVANQMCVCVFFFIRFSATEITIKSHHVVLFWYRVWPNYLNNSLPFKFGSIFNICFSNAIIPSIGELYKLFRIDTGISLEFFFSSSTLERIFLSFSILFLSIYHTFTLRITVQFFSFLYFTISIFSSFSFQSAN